jgi:hypothetical protein
MPVKLKNSLLGLLLCLCSSCQTGTSCDPRSWERGWPFSKPELSANFVWDDYSTAPPIKGILAYFWNDANQYWVVIWYEGQRLQRHIDQIVLLYLKKEQLEGCWTRYQLKEGLAVETAFLGGTSPPESVVTLRLLKSEFFRGENDCGMTLFYNGKASGSSKASIYHDDDGKDMNWLRFEVVPKKNKQKVTSAVEKLYPLLEKEPDARDILTCLEPLLLEQSRNK